MISLGNIYPDPDKNSSKETTKSKFLKSNLKVLIFSISTVVVMVVVLVLVARKNNSNSLNTTINVPTETTTLLTPAEVENERLHLPTYPAVSSTLEADKSVTTSSSSAVILTDNEVNSMLRTTKETSTSHDPVRADSVNMNVPTSISNEPGSNDKVNNVSIAYAKSERNLSDQKRKGVLQNIDLNSHSFILVDENKILKINITSETKFFINSKAMSVSGLQLGDVLEISGSGYNNVSELTASTIDLVAKFKPI